MNNSVFISEKHQFIRKLCFILRIRQRYVFTSSNRLRLRVWAALYVFFALFIMAVSLLADFSENNVTANSFVSAADAKIHVEENVTTRLADITPAAGKIDSKENTAYVIGHYANRQKVLSRHLPSDDEYENAPMDVKAPIITENIFKIGTGDTLSAVMVKAGLSDKEAFIAAKSVAEYLDPRNIKPGQEVLMRFEEKENNPPVFKELEIAVNPLKSVKLTKSDNDGFKSSLIEEEAVTRQYVQSTDIEVSLYGSALKAGVPVSVIAKTIHTYSWDVDFQRDIRQGDTIEVMYEREETKDGIPVSSGKIIYARLNVNGRDIPVYRFETKDGDVDYFGPDGRSVRKALMKTPIDGARISSGYGKRRHPVLGYNKMHKGVDFAAPRGTPIYAAGDGKIEMAERWSSFGNYIRIRHNSELKTAYAHLKGFAKGIRAGKRVKQGQIIGYVGTTGRSTGPHLHYEVLKNNVQINPRNLKLPQGETLRGQQLADLKAHIGKIDKLYASINSNGGKNIKYASLR
jgi:murein DD-endopeptidase MepM/ murein hydrolase activator NlpD